MRSIGRGVGPTPDIRPCPADPGADLRGLDGVEGREVKVGEERLVVHHGGMGGVGGAGGRRGGAGSGEEEGTGRRSRRWDARLGFLAAQVVRREWGEKGMGIYERSKRGDLREAC